MPLILAGSKKAADETAINDALLLSTYLSRWQPQIAGALYEHFEPYAETYADSRRDADGDALPAIRNAQDAWQQSTLLAVAIAPLDRVLTTELYFDTCWDEEHTLSARFQRGQWLELCGSTVIP